MSQPMYLGIYVKMYTCMSVFTCAHIASDRTNDNTENKWIQKLDSHLQSLNHIQNVAAPSMGTPKT